MRKLRGLLLALPLAGLAAPASAATLPFRGRIDAVFGIFPAVTVEATGVATVNGAGALGGALTRLELPAGAFHAAGLNFPGTGIIEQVRITAANGIGSFVLTPLGGGGAMPLPGLVRICLVLTCDAAPAPLLLPLDPVGAGGSARVTGAVDITVEGMPWTKGRTTISTPGAVTILEGFAHGPLSNTTTAATIGGVLELVTPVAVHTDLSGLEEITGFAVLHLEFVPEPASGLLVGAGLALLALGARRVRARRS